MRQEIGLLGFRVGAALAEHIERLRRAHVHRVTGFERVREHQRQRACPGPIFNAVRGV